MILVTGGTGLVGSHLLLQLVQQNQPVRAMYRNPDKIARTKKLFDTFGHAVLFDRIQWVLADVTDIPSLEIAFDGVSRVYHCAALISFDPSDEEKLRKSNIEGTANIVNCCLAFGILKLVYVSSTAAIGDLKDGETMLSEESEWNPEKPHNDYSISKYGAEMEIWRGKQEGLKIAILNPGVTLGSGFWDSGSGQIFTLIKKGMSFYTEGTTGFVSATDTAKLLQILMKSETSGERYIAVSENLSFRNVANLIADALNVERPKRKATRFLTGIAWRIDWFLGVFGKKRKITKDDARSLHSFTAYSNKKIVEAFGFEFEPVEASVKRIVAEQSIQRVEHQDQR